MYAFCGLGSFIQPKVRRRECCALHNPEGVLMLHAMLQRAVRFALTKAQRKGFRSAAHGIIPKAHLCCMQCYAERWVRFALTKARRKGCRIRKSKENQRVSLPESVPCVRRVVDEVCSNQGAEKRIQNGQTEPAGVTRRRT